MPEAEKPKGKRGGPRPGGGRPKSALTHLKELAKCEGLVWYMSPEITAAGILYALNGDSGLLKQWLDRIYGRTEERAPLIDRVDQVEANLPEDFDPEALFAELREKLMGGVGAGEWTSQEANRVGRLGVATLEKLAARGDKQAAAILARVHLPDPVLTLSERLPTMTPEELRETMIARWSATWPWKDRAEIERMADAAMRGSKEREDAES